MNTVTFTSQFKKNMIIQTRDGSSNYCDKTVSVVELDRKNNHDIDTMFAIGDNWSKQGFNYAQSILISAISDEDETDWTDKLKEHYIAMTLQDDNFEKLDPKKVIGLSLLSEYNYDNEINYLQVKPTNSYSKVGEKRKYKKIGTAMLDYMKSISEQKPIFVNSALEAVNFYTMNDFKRVSEEDPTKLYYNV